MSWCGKDFESVNFSFEWWKCAVYYNICVINQTLNIVHYSCCFPFFFCLMASRERMKEDRNWFKPWVVRADQQQTPPCNTSLPPSRAQKSEQLNYYQQEPLDYATRRHGSASSKYLIYVSVIFTSWPLDGVSVLVNSSARSLRHFTKYVRLNFSAFRLPLFLSLFFSKLRLWQREGLQPSSVERRVLFCKDGWVYETIRPPPWMEINIKKHKIKQNEKVVAGEGQSEKRERERESFAVYLAICGYVRDSRELLHDPVAFLVDVGGSDSAGLNITRDHRSSRM